MRLVSTEPAATTGAIRWRTLEWWGAGFAIFVQTGAVTGYGSLRRLLLVLSFAIVGLLLLRCRDQLRLAVSRSLPLAALLLLPFASVLWSISSSISLRRAIGLLASVALAYVLAIRFTPRQLATLVAAVLGPCMLLSLVYAAGLPGLGWMPDDGGMRGVFGHKNILGWYASISIIASAAVMAGDGAAARRCGGLLFAASLLCLVASGSMTGLLSTSAAFCLATFYAVLKRLRGLARTLFVLVVLQLLAVVAISTTELLAPTLEALGKDATLTGRIPLWRLVDREIAEHLLFGVGYQAFWTEANPDAWAIWSKLGWPAPHAHNGYRDTLLNFGLVGMAIFMAAIARALVQGATLLGRAPQDGWLWLNVTVGMFLVMNLTESLFLMQNDFLFVLFATALIMFGLRAPEVRRSPPPPVAAGRPLRRSGPGSRSGIDRKEGARAWVMAPFDQVTEVMNPSPDPGRPNLRPAD